jgi:hypothetical protein
MSVILVQQIANLPNTQTFTVCSSFTPLVSNIVIWENLYRVYASTTETAIGARIIPALETPQPLPPGRAYRLQGGRFADSGARTSADFEIANQEARPYTVGLLQGVSANGHSTLVPIGATRVQPGGRATTTPGTGVWIYIWERQQPGTVTSWPQNATMIRFDGDDGRFNLGYDRDSGRFLTVRPPGSWSE